MIPVAQALEHLFALVGPLETELVPLRRASGRRLAKPVTAARTQPPFAASSMDGYAVKSAEVEQHAQFKVIGESAAGHGFDGLVRAGQAVRIFTGAPVPDDTDFVVIQEDVERNGDLITLVAESYSKDNIRPAGADFEQGTPFAPNGPLGPGDIALMASMNQAELVCYRKPIIAIIATGDELVQPGEVPGPDQIIASNSFGLAAMFEARGADVRLLPIARDSIESLTTAFGLAQGVDLIVTIGGASVGDHDLVAQVAETLGMERSFYKVAMRPGKPLMAGRLNGTPMIGLPGNPVSALVCGSVFIAPVIDVMLGHTAGPAPLMSAPLAAPLGANGPREHYMRAKLGPDGLTIFDRQDSSLLTVLADANALVVRTPHDPPREVGEILPYIAL